MKTSNKKPAKSPQNPVFPQMLHRMRSHPDAVAGTSSLPPKPRKRDNTFSKSRDTREDRGSRQMKTSHNAQTFSHGR